jgi:hypothetical protein
MPCGSTFLHVDTVSYPQIASLFAQVGAGVNWRGSCTTSKTMSSSKSPEALDTLEADLRSRLDEEVRTLEAYRGRLEREARVDAELARIDAVIARRVGSMPPPAMPSYHPASYHPASHHPASYHPASYHPASYPPPASFHSAPPPAMPSWNPPSSMLPPAAVAPAPTSQPIPYAYQTSRMVTLATVSAMLAVIVSLTVLVITAGDRMVPSANAAERPTMSAPANVAANGGSCSDKSDKAEPAKKTDDAKSEPATATVAKAVAPAAKNTMMRRTATKSAPASKTEAPAAAEPVAVAPVAAPALLAAAPAPAPAPAPAATNMDDAARTAQMLREQLGASLK